MKLRDIGIGLGVAVGVAGTVYALAVRPWQLRRGATDDEVRRTLPGDDLVPDPTYGYTQAITIKAPVADVWPWLLQVGYKRAGWYSHDAIHRLLGIAGCVDDDRRSAQRVIPELQDVKVGDVVELAPDMGYTVGEIQPEHALVWKLRVNTGTWEAVPDGDPLPETYFCSTWVWVLDAVDEQTTRLLVRVRSDCDPGLQNALMLGIPNELGSLVMQPQMLQGIKQRAEMAAGQ